MTSFAFILGVVPLLVGHGAGAEMRQVLGVAVFSGMLGVTLFGIFLTPVFFYVIEGLIENPLFSSERMRRAGQVLLYVVGILTLGIPWLLAPLGRARQRSRPLTPSKRLAAAAAGHVAADGHGAMSHGGPVKGVCTGSGSPETNGTAKPDSNPEYAMRK